MDGGSVRRAETGCFISGSPTRKLSHGSGRLNLLRPCEVPFLFATFSLGTRIVKPIATVWKNKLLPEFYNPNIF